MLKQAIPRAFEKARALQADQRAWRPRAFASTFWRSSTITRMLACLLLAVTISSGRAGRPGVERARQSAASAKDYGSRLLHRHRSERIGKALLLPAAAERDRGTPTILREAMRNYERARRLAPA